MNSHFHSFPMPKPYQLTQHGLQMFLDRVQALEEKRLAIIERIRTSTEQTAELADISDSLGSLQQIDNEIANTDYIIRHATVLKAAGGDRIALGTVIRLRCEEVLHQFTIVDSLETKPEIGLISDKSPLGKLLIGKQIQQRVTLQLPQGKKTYEIIEIL